MIGKIGIRVLLAVLLIEATAGPRTGAVFAGQTAQECRTQRDCRLSLERKKI